MADVQIATSQDQVDIQMITDVDADGLMIEMGSEVEVVATPKRGRGRPKAGKPLNSSKSTDEPSRPKRSSRKRPAKSSDHVSKTNRKYTKRNKKDDKNTEGEKLGIEEKGRRARRKKESNERKSRPSRDKNQRRKSNIKNQTPVAPLNVSKNYTSSGEDSVVFMDDIPPSVTIPSTPPDLSPYNSNRYEPDKPRRLEDSSSNGSSSSSSSSDSDSDYSVSSIGSRLTDKSDRSMERVPSPPVNNGYDHRNPSPLGWSQCTSSGSEGENAEKKNNGSGRTPSTPPRSPSSASSESADKSFQCHTCRKWFSSTVTLRIHKRSHVMRPGGSTSSGGRSSRRYECDCCDATFTRRERLEQHRSETHRGSLTVQCEVCGRGFEDEEQQKRHAATHTADERAGRCTICGEIVGGWEQLRRHRALHTTPPTHACPLCRKAFTYVQSLSRHLLNHSKAVYKCVVCKTSFDDANALASHLNSHLDRYKQLKT